MNASRPNVAWLALLAALALVAAACGGDGTGDAGEGSLVAPVDTVPEEDTTADADTTEEITPQHGGTLRVAVEAEADGLSPAHNNMAVSAYMMTYPVVEPVAYWNTEGKWVPYLAESFTKIGDGSSWQMKLREGVRFHDGSELDADDVVATFEAQLADPLISLAVRPAFPPEGAIAKIDDYTVQYNPVRAYAAFPQTLTSQLGMVLPSEWLEQAAADPTLEQTPVGTGPFMIESRTQDEVTVLVRNPDYWAAGTSELYLDRIEVYPITDTAIAAERLAAGDLDVMVTSNAEAILTLRESDGVSTIENVRSSEDFAMLNVTQPPFDDIRARQAITFATPREAYLNLIRQGTSPAADTMFHPDLIWNNPDVVQEVDMPERAGPLVDAYCADNPGNCSDGKINIELQYSGPSVVQTRIADLLIDGWEDFFNVTEQELLQDEHILQVAVGQWNVVTWRQFGEIDPDNDVLWLQCDAISAISLNWPRHCTPERDALMFEQRASDDLDRRVEIWREIQQEIKDSYTYIFFNHANWTIGLRDSVQNVCGNKTPAEGLDLFCNNQGRVMLQHSWISN